MIESYLENAVSFSGLPLEKLRSLPYGVYVLDKDWNYLCVSDYVPKNLGISEQLEGQNMWVRFPALKTDMAFMTLKKNSELGLKSNFTTTSPLTSQKLHIVSFVLQDCYVVFSLKQSDKTDLIDELRQAMAKKNS
ncbi:MAG: hypothetical protein V4615_06240 [Bacteroidota bacterium]